MKKFLIPLLCTAILLLCGGCDLSDKVRIGTAAEGGNYYIFGSELNAIDSLESYNINIKRTAGSAANMRLLSENYLQMAVVQTDIIDDAWNGRNGFTEEYHDFGAVAGLFTESCQITVRSDSDIKSVSDLKGKTASVVSGLVAVKAEVNGLDVRTVREETQQGFFSHAAQCKVALFLPFLFEQAEER